MTVIQATGGDTPAAIGPHAEAPDRFALVPAEMKARARWLLWKRELAEDGKVKKVPYRIDGVRANPVDEASWMWFNDVVKAMPLISADGIGYAFTAKDDICGIDLDRARYPETGRLTFVARGLIKKYGSYTEWSPSGEGVHIFFKGRKPTGSRCKALVNAETKESIEFYDSQRFFTVTGQHVAGTPTDVREVSDDLTITLVTFMQGCAGGESSASVAEYRADDGSPERDDAEVLRMMFAAKNGMEQLYFGVGPAVGDGSESDADWALAKELAFWTGRKRVQIERIMRARPIEQREKWNRAN